MQLYRAGGSIYEMGICWLAYLKADNICDYTTNLLLFNNNLRCIFIAKYSVFYQIKLFIDWSSKMEHIVIHNWIEH